MRRFALSWIFILSVSVLSVAVNATSPTTRSITINNYCPFDVTMTSVGSNASMKACSPSTTSAQANCPSGFVCYAKDKNTNYCVAGTAVTPTPALPLSSTSDITLESSTCSGGLQITDTSSSSWGQCACSTSTDCPSSQQCQTVAGTTKQCYWNLALPNGGKLGTSSPNNSIAITIAASAAGADTMVASGKMYPKFACDVNGNCLSDNTMGAPASAIEFTFQNNQDWYDVTYINGMNMPMTMYPVMSTNLSYSKDDPYACMPAGGDATTIGKIKTFQSANKIKGNSTLLPFACTNNYDSTFNTSSNIGLNFVSAETTETNCSTNTDCTVSGTVCGLNLTSVTGNLTQTTCGHRLGYWTYAQLCAANSAYTNSGLGVNCSDSTKLAYAQCKNQAGLNDHGPGRSCFNSNTTTTGETCCGYSKWKKGNAKQPMANGSNAVSGVVTTTWTTDILPMVESIKEGCYLAYSFQFDDPYSTFTCHTTSAGNNTASYNVDLCANGKTAGILPPAASCTVAANLGNQFTIGPPANITVAVRECSQGKCKKKLAPVATNTYAAKPAYKVYEVTATNASSATQTCKYNIPQSACITPADLTPPAGCANWSIATTGAWAGRAIQFPAF